MKVMQMNSKSHARQVGPTASRPTPRQRTAAPVVPQKPSRDATRESGASGQPFLPTLLSAFIFIGGGAQALPIAVLEATRFTLRRPNKAPKGGGHGRIKTPSIARLAFWGSAKAANNGKGAFGDDGHIGPKPKTSGGSGLELLGGAADTRSRYCGQLPSVKELLQTRADHQRANT